MHTSTRPCFACVFANKLLSPQKTPFSRPCRIATSFRHYSHQPLIFRLQPNHEDRPPSFSRVGNRYPNTLGYVDGRYHVVGSCMIWPRPMVAITGYRRPKQIEPFRRSAPPLGTDTPDAIVRSPKRMRNQDRVPKTTSNISQRDQPLPKSFWEWLILMQVYIQETNLGCSYSGHGWDAPGLPHAVLGPMMECGPMMEHGYVYITINPNCGNIKR